MEYAWDGGDADGDLAKYEGRLAVLENVAAQLGFGRVGRAWEVDWSDELEVLWPVIQRVAEGVREPSAVVPFGIALMVSCMYRTTVS